MNQLDYTKIKNFCFSRDDLNRRERQVVNWEKVFAIYTTDKPQYYIKNILIYIHNTAI